MSRISQYIEALKTHKASKQLLSHFIMASTLDRFIPTTQESGKSCIVQAMQLAKGELGISNDNLMELVGISIPTVMDKSHTITKEDVSRALSLPPLKLTESLDDEDLGDPSLEVSQKEKDHLIQAFLSHHISVTPFYLAKLAVKLDLSAEDFFGYANGIIETGSHASGQLYHLRDSIPLVSQYIDTLRAHKASRQILSHFVQVVTLERFTTSFSTQINHLRKCIIYAIRLAKRELEISDENCMELIDIVIQIPRHATFAYFNILCKESREHTISRKDILFALSSKPLSKIKESFDDDDLGGEDTSDFPFIEAPEDVILETYVDYNFQFVLDEYESERELTRIFIKLFTECNVVPARLIEILQNSNVDYFNGTLGLQLRDMKRWTQNHNFQEELRKHGTKEAYVKYCKIQGIL